MIDVDVDATPFPMPQLECATRFPNVPSRVATRFQVELRLAFECSNSNTNDRQFEVCVFGWVFFYNNYYFLSQYAFHVYVLIVIFKA